jgi:hypothetical protein
MVGAPFADGHPSNYYPTAWSRERRMQNMGESHGVGRKALPDFRSEVNREL